MQDKTKGPSEPADAGGEVTSNPQPSNAPKKGNTDEDEGQK